MKYSKLILSCGLLLPLLWGCKKLDYSEASYFNKESIYADFNRTSYVLDNIYSYLPTDFNPIDGAMRSSASDDAEHVWDLSAIQRFNDGSWSSIQTLDDQWANMYAGIRAVNIFLKETQGRTFEDLHYTDGYSDLLTRFHLFPYEARFLRAFFYFELTKRYGDVPLVTTILTQEEANKVTRAPYRTVVDFIVSECDAISDSLPVSFASVPASETGRATKGAALALKTRTLLYAASPLHNPSGDQNKWIAAAAAAKVIIDGAWYSLDPSYGNVVNSLSSPELIFETRQPESNAFEAANFPIGFEGGNTGTCPTQNLVDAYEMQGNGKGIGEAGSGYDPANPYQGRDPRLSATVLYNGALLKGQPVQTWYGGLNAHPVLNATKTGYYLKKYVIESVSLSPTTPNAKVHTWVTFRLGEVLLNYAEAMNEAYGPAISGSGSLQLTATAAVNLLRARANMPPFPAGMTTEDFRNKLRNERRVELAFEDHRFWDLRRWRIGPATKDIYGVDVTKTGSAAFSYSRKLVEKRVWDDKMYLYPIPQSELYLNKNLTPNPGW